MIKKIGIKIFTAKLILDAPDRYGFDVAPEDRYALHATDAVTVSIVGHVRVQELAAAAGLFYREIKTLNPAILGDGLVEGRYELRVPKGGGARLARSLPELGRAMVPRAGRRVVYQVKRGDTLLGIAERFGVSVEALRKSNAAARRPHLYPGDSLVIEDAGHPAAGK